MNLNKVIEDIKEDVKDEVINILEKNKHIEESILHLYEEDEILEIVEKYIREKDYPIYYDNNFDEIEKVVNPLLYKDVCVDKDTYNGDKLVVLSIYIAYKIVETLDIDTLG